MYTYTYMYTYTRTHYYRGFRRARTLSTEVCAALEGGMPERLCLHAPRLAYTRRGLFRRKFIPQMVAWVVAIPTAGE